ncbi:hypothetical protein QQ045_015208 [Rhodiola kirilowii]
MFWKSAMPAAASSSAPFPAAAAAADRGFSILDHTNLDRFLDSVTPCLPLHSIPQVAGYQRLKPVQVAGQVAGAFLGELHFTFCEWVRESREEVLHESGIHGINTNWLPVGDEHVPYFKLGDLWQGFDQASAYGVGSRVLFDNGDVVTQYYSPFLSAIQVFTNIPYASARCDSDILWSCENKSEKVSRSMSNNLSTNPEALPNGITENRSSQSNENRDYIYLNHCEFTSPFFRIPFYEKIMELAQSRPELMTLNSIELSPQSWLSVLWYPIYNIPSQKRSKDLSTVFLAYYNLSSSCLGDQAIPETHDEGKSPEKENPKEAKKDMICLRPFGLSTFKMSGNTWTKNESDQQKISSLHNAAASWLKHLNFFHNDFTFYLNQPSESHK